MWEKIKKLDLDIKLLIISSILSLFCSLYSFSIIKNIGIGIIYLIMVAMNTSSIIMKGKGK